MSRHLCKTEKGKKKPKEDLPKIIRSRKEYLARLGKVMKEDYGKDLSYSELEKMADGIDSFLLSNL